MRLGLVIGSLTSTDNHPCYEGRTLLLVQRVTMDREPMGIPTMAIDYVGAGPGDLIMLGAAPGLASSVLEFPKAPVQQLIMGIVDRVELADDSFTSDEINESFSR